MYNVTDAKRREGFIEEKLNSRKKGRTHERKEGGNEEGKLSPT